MDRTVCCKKPAILAVDDNEDNLFLLQYQLSELLECQVLTALSGKAALALIETQAPDLVLIDIVLPEMDGMEVARRLKQCARTAKIPIIAVTALARTEDRDRILDSGCDDCVTKPYELDALGATILRYLLPCPHP